MKKIPLLALLALTLAFGIGSFAQTQSSTENCRYWIDAATRDKAKTGPPGYWDSGAGAENKTAYNWAGHAYQQQADDNWGDAATGQNVIAGPPGYWDSGAAAGHKTAYDWAGQTYRLVPCPPTPLQQRPPTPARLRYWATGDCVAAGKYVGIDYMRALNRAIAKNPAGLATLFRFTDTSGFDGEAAEGHVVILLGLLQRWGDRPFAQVLRSQKPSVRKAVIDELDSLIQGYRGKPTRLFPRTFAPDPPADSDSR